MLHVSILVDWTFPNLRTENWDALRIEMHWRVVSSKGPLIQQLERVLHWSSTLVSKTPHTLRGALTRGDFVTKVQLEFGRISTQKYRCNYLSLCLPPSTPSERTVKLGSGTARQFSLMIRFTVYLISGGTARNVNWQGVLISNQCSLLIAARREEERAIRWALLIGTSRTSRTTYQC